MKITVLIALLSLTTQVFAKRIQIIHTNDLHSYFTGQGPDQGGYYRVKALIDDLKKTAQDQGISSIVLDAGDFGEGSYHFLVDDGIESFKSLDLLGVDAAVIGNHDYMFGGKKLASQIKDADISTVFLGANMAPTEDMKLEGLVHPSVRFDVEGVEVEVIGLTTPSLHFMYAFRPGLVFPPNNVSMAHSKMARESGADLVVALTHLGVSGDISLVKADPEIDLVIGGHSHTRLESSLNVKNTDGRTIPIVQTGAHGMAVGSLIIDVNGPKDYKIIKYQLFDTDVHVKPDLEILKYANDFEDYAKEKLSDGRWNEVIGSSDITLNGYSNGNHDNGDGCWIGHLGNIVKEGSDSDIGLYLGSFTGKEIEPGPITVGNIIENFPHLNEYGQKGWEVAKFEIKGYKILAILLGIINLNIPDGHIPSIGGIEYETFKIPMSIPYIGGKTFFTSLNINGQGFEWKRKYSLSLPFEFKKMLDGLLPGFLRTYFPEDFERNDYFLWEMAEKYISNHSPLSCKKVL
jgi:2',3'-cyclic-nucleotide 2'-phosphodiesterase (5'-nucleotidase family)